MSSDNYADSPLLGVRLLYYVGLRQWICKNPGFVKVFGNRGGVSGRGFPLP